MADKKQAVFVKVTPGSIKVSGKIVSHNERMIGDFDKIKGLPGMHFIGFLDEMQKSNLSNHIVVNKTDDIEIQVQVNNNFEENNDKKEIGFSPERLKELKKIEPNEWVKKKKSEFISVLEEGNIDYSAVKDDRMSLYKFLIGVLKEL